MEERKTLGQWAFDMNIRLLDEEHYDDKELYTLKEYEEIIPRNIEVPLNPETPKRKELLVLNNDTYLLDTETASKIAEFERTMKELKKKQDEIKEQLKYEMAAKGIKSIKDEVNNITITYVAPTERETFDSKSFRADHEDLYNDYIKFSEIKDSVRISVK